MNMGTAINSEKEETGPKLSPDGKYFFFIRGDWHVNKNGKRVYEGKQHWVDVKIIDGLRAKSD
jgi:hypothetical protein